MKWLNKLKDWWNQRQKLAFSTNYTCIRCGKEVFDNSFFCSDCNRSLPRNLPFICPRCGRKSEQGAGICQLCKADPPNYLRARAPFCYADEIVGYIKGLKNGELFYSVLFGREMESYRTSFPKLDFVISVPMTERAKKKRGYNQAQLLSDYLSEAWGVPVYHDLLIKQRETGEQKSLSRRERKENIKSAFHLVHRKPFEGKGVLIVDDVMTTGATVNEIARSLQGAGAKYIYVLTASSTMLRDDQK